MSKKVLIEAFAIVEVPQKHAVGLTVVPMREKDVPNTNVCAIYVDKQSAERVLSTTTVKGVRIVPCYVTYNEPVEA